MHFRALKFVNHDDSSTFKELLEHDNSVTIHHRNIQYFAIELFKVKSGSAPVFLNNIFSTRIIPDNSRISSLRSQTDFYNYHNPRTVRFGTETLRSLGPKIWNIIPTDIKNSASAETPYFLENWPTFENKPIQN